MVAPAGSYVLKPRDVPRVLYNAGTEPVRVLEILTPGGFESYFDEYGGFVGGLRTRRSIGGREPSSASASG